MASRMWSSEKFLDYDSYKLDISSIGDKIWDKLDSLDDGDEVNDLDSEEEIDVDLDYEDVDVDEKENEEDSSIDDDASLKGQTIKSFPKSVKFVKFPEIKEETNSEIIWQLTWYSKSDLLWVINKYIEENLDDYTDILVTVEYEDDNDTPQRIILETQSKTKWNWNSVYFLWSADELLESVELEKNDGKSSDDVVIKNSNNQTQTAVQSVKKTTSNKLSQKDQQEAEEIFSILF